MRLSLSFGREEFDCHDGSPVPVELLQNLQRLVTDVLQPLRNRWGRPLIVISGYRSPEYNKRIGGAGASTHMTALGADIRPIHLAELGALAGDVEEMWQGGLLPDLGGFGRYANWIHLDARKAADGHLRRWHGRGVGAEDAG